MKPDIYNAISTLANNHGIEAATEVAEFEMENLRAVQTFVDEEKIDCDLDVTHAIDVQLDDDYCAKLRTGWESLIAQGSKVSELVEVKMREDAEDVCLVRFTH